MKKFIAIFIAVSFLVLNVGYVTPSHADAVTQKIPSEATAKELAANCGGAYVPGADAPALTGTQVALPVVSEGTNKVLGYIVCDKEALVSALNAAGYASVASAISAAEAGATAGLAVGAGISTGTIVVGAAVLAGIAALAVSSGGGGGGGGGSTTNH